MGELAFTKMATPVDPSFTCGVASIDQMIRDSYLLCLLKRSYAYEVSAAGKVVAYYRIELRRFDNSQFDPPIEEHSIGRYTDLYALHIQYIAVHKDYQRHHIGNAILEHILCSVDDIVRYCPLRLITIEAFQELVGWYTRHYFEALETSRENPETELMFIDLISAEDMDKINADDQAFL